MNMDEQSPRGWPPAGHLSFIGESHFLLGLLAFDPFIGERDAKLQQPRQ